MYEGKLSPEEIDGLPEEEVAYWKLVDSLRKLLNELEAHLLQKKCSLSEFGVTAVIAERPDASGINMECSATGKRQITIDWIDLESQAAYKKWKAESEHEPVIVNESP